MCGKKLFAKNTRQLTNSFRQYLVKYSPTAIFGKHLLTKQTTHSGQKVSAIVRPFCRRRELWEKSTSNFAEKNSGSKGSKTLEGHILINKTLFPPHKTRFFCMMNITVWQSRQESRRETCRRFMLLKIWTWKINKRGRLK